MTSIDEAMGRCLDLAQQGQLLVGNGAMVGAVLLRDGVIIAEGWHRGFGLPHAERDLLDAFPGAILPTDILCVNLEPCRHRGKTPPCTELLLERGVRRVAYGMEDPDERNAGRGIAMLRQAGVEVIGPVEEECCKKLNRGFISVRTTHRPWITLKRALSTTSEQQNIRSHTELRCTHDAILVGVSTVVTDNPRLDARLDSKKREYHPYRIILDPHLRIPPTSRVVTDAHRNRTIVIHSPSASADAKKALEESPVLLREVSLQNGLFDWPALWDALCTPIDTYHGLTSILVEGGKRTWDAFTGARMVDAEILLRGDAPVSSSSS